MQHSDELIRKSVFFLAAGFAGAVIALFAEDVYHWAKDRVAPATPGLTVQLNRIIRDGPGPMVYSRSAKLTGTGAKSEVLLFRTNPGGPYSDEASTELRIYNVEAGKFKLRLKVRPEPFKARGLLPGIVPPDAELVTGFQPMRFVDLDHNGSVELIGFFFPFLNRWPLPPPGFVQPVIVTWSAQRQRYEIAAILDAELPPFVRNSIREDLIRVPQRQSEAYLRHTFHITPIEIRDSSEDLAIRTYSTDVFYLPKGTPQFLVAGFTVRGGTRTGRTLQLLIWTLSVDPVVAALPCTVRPAEASPILVRVPPGEQFLPRFLERAWPKLKKKLNC